VVFGKSLALFREHKDREFLALCAQPDRTPLQESLVQKGAQFFSQVTLMALISVRGQIADCHGPKPSDLTQGFKLRRTDLVSVPALLDGPGLTRKGRSLIWRARCRVRLAPRLFQLTPVRCFDIAAHRFTRSVSG
jgi:hypothetical protein